MLYIREAIVVEGRYDKNTLSQLVDTIIIETEGFGIFKNKEKVALLRRLAKQRGLIILTDSDGAGFLIRNHLRGSIDPALLKQAYIPDRYGKESRKRQPGKEGKLGVEGMPPQVLEQALRQAGATFLGKEEDVLKKGKLTKGDLYALGLTGGEHAVQKRKALQHRLDLPEHMTTNGLLEILNSFYTVEELQKIMEEFP